MSLTAFSQRGISKKDSCVISLPCKVAYQVVTDLVRCDSIATELDYKQSVLTITQNKVAIQDAIIQAHLVKESNYREQITQYQQQIKQYGVVVTGLEKDKNKLRFHKKVLGFLASVATTAALVEFLIIKTK